LTPYYILFSDNFDPNKIESVSSGSQLGFTTISDDTPCSLIKKSSTQNHKEFIEYNLITETLKKQKGRAYGKPDIFRNFILIKDDLLFYNQANSILLLSTSKDNFYRFMKRFENNTLFKFRKISVNFSSIIDNALNLGTDGVWLGNLDDTNINALGLLGTKVQASTEYQQHVQNGAIITNISFIYDYNNEQEKIMISKDGGIILFHSKSKSEDLKLVLDVYTKMLL